MQPSVAFKSLLFLLCCSKILPAANTPTNITFFAISDVHYGLYTPENDTNRNRMPTYLNNLPGTPYPQSIGGYVGEPKGVLIAGDLIERQEVELWRDYTTIYGVSGEKKLRYPVFDGLGNHDFSVTGTIKDTLFLVKQMIARNYLRMASLTSLDSIGYHYSWDWDGVHFVNLNLYAGSTELGYNGWRPLQAREFLEKDLAENVGNSDRPVILFQHFTMGPNVTPDWTDESKAAMYAILKNYNVVAIIHGHSHAKKLYKWQGIDVIDDGAAILGDMVVFHITNGHLLAVYRNQETWSETLILDKAIRMGTPPRDLPEVTVPKSPALDPGNQGALPPTVKIRNGTIARFQFTVLGSPINLTPRGSLRQIHIIDIRGKRIRTLRPIQNGAEWDMLDASGRRAAPGLYLVLNANLRPIGKFVLR